MSTDGDRDERADELVRGLLAASAVAYADSVEGAAAAEAYNAYAELAVEASDRFAGPVIDRLVIVVHLALQELATAHHSTELDEVNRLADVMAAMPNPGDPWPPESPNQS